MFTIYNDFLNVKHGLLIFIKTKFKHLMHENYLFLHNHLLFFIIIHTFNLNENFKQIHDQKTNSNIKF